MQTQQPHARIAHCWQRHPKSGDMAPGCGSCDAGIRYAKNRNVLGGYFTEKALCAMRHPDCVKQKLGKVASLRYLVKLGDEEGLGERLKKEMKRTRIESQRHCNRVDEPQRIGV